MGDAFEYRVPPAPGWYWVKFSEAAKPEALEVVEKVVHGETRLELVGWGLVDETHRQVFDNGSERVWRDPCFLFGPRIPAPNETPTPTKLTVWESVAEDEWVIDLQCEKCKGPIDANVSAGEDGVTIGTSCPKCDVF